VFVSATLRDLLGEVTVGQTYRNDEDVNIEASTHFRSPLDAVLLDLRVEIGGRTGFSSGATRGERARKGQRASTRNQRQPKSRRIFEGNWLAALDDFRNWLALGLQPAKAHENRSRVRMAPAGAARSNRASGAVEAEQLFDPERA
jgi:hypothetical protein